MSDGESGFRVGRYSFPSDGMSTRSAWHTAPEWEPSQKEKERKYKSRGCPPIARHNMGGYRIGFATDAVTHTGMRAFLGSGLLT